MLYYFIEIDNDIALKDTQ